MDIVESVQRMDPSNPAGPSERPGLDFLAAGELHRGDPGPCGVAANVAREELHRFNGTRGSLRFRGPLHGLPLRLLLSTVALALVHSM